MTRDHTTTFKDDVENIFSKMDGHAQQFFQIDDDLLQQLTALEDKLSAEEKKAAELLQHNAEQFNNDYQKIGFAVAQIAAGVVITGATHGIGATAGTALISEGLTTIGAILDLDIHPHEKPLANKNMSDLVQAVESKKNAITEELNQTWIDNINKHCDQQLQHLKAMTAAIPDHPDNKASLTEIANLTQYYQTKKNEVAGLSVITDHEEKTKLITDIAKSIEKNEKKVAPTIDKITGQFPTSLKSTAAKWFKQAQHFLHQNKEEIKAIKYATLALAGIALSIATGGVGAILGAAILGAVAFKNIKSIRKNIHPTHDIHTSIAAHITEHCKRQKDALNDIKKSLSSSNYSHVNQELEKLCEKYESYAKKVREIEKDENKSLQEKIDALKSTSQEIEQLDKLGVKQISTAGELPINAKKEADLYSKRQIKFPTDNQRIFSVARKVALAAAALTIIGICTGGIGVAAAVGFAVATYAASKIIDKAVKTVNKIRQQNKSIHQDSKGEGTAKTEKEGEKDSGSKGLHH